MRKIFSAFLLILLISAVLIILVQPLQAQIGTPTALSTLSSSFPLPNLSIAPFDAWFGFLIILVVIIVAVVVVVMIILYILRLEKLRDKQNTQTQT